MTTDFFFFFALLTREREQAEGTLILRQTQFKAFNRERTAQ